MKLVNIRYGKGKPQRECAIDIDRIITIGKIEGDQKLHVLLRGSKEDIMLEFEFESNEMRDRVYQELNCLGYHR